MRKLLNTLYVTTEDAYLSLDGENIVVNIDDNRRSFPLHMLESIVCFSYKGASPALMGKCASKEIQLSFFTPYGKYLASSWSDTNGNVLLRREQYRLADQEKKALAIAKAFICGKIYNTKYFLKKFLRDYESRINVERMDLAVEIISKDLLQVSTAKSIAELRGIEGDAAREYFNVFNDLILQNKRDFHFYGRSRRPPVDAVNALLSFAYSLLANDYTAALHSVGLDPYVGFLHKDRAGRCSLALDLMEELRSVYADRFVLTLINNRIFHINDFIEQENGAVLLKDKARKQFLSEWQNKKRVAIVHPFLEEKITWGLVPYTQALLLARFVRGDIDNYPPFFWK